MIAGGTRTVASRLRAMLPRRLGRAGAALPAPRRSLRRPSAQGGGVLGVEIARNRVRFAELGGWGGKVALRVFGEVEHDPKEDLAPILRRIVAEHGIQARDVHLVNSTSRANLRINPMPEMPDRDLDSIVQAEIASEAELLGEPLIGDWCWLHRAGEDSEILVGKIPIREREEIARACLEAGLRLQVMSSSSVLLARHVISSGGVPEGEIVGLLDIGSSKMNMALITHEHVRLVREVYQGLSASFLEDETPGDEADLDAIGAGLDEVVGTVQQIKRTWQQFQESHARASMHHVLMTGETTRIGPLLGLLQHDLQVPVQMYDPTAGLDPAVLPVGFREVAASFAVPWVLATTRAADVDLNFAEGVPDPRPKRVLQGVGAAGVLAMMVLGGLQIAGSRKLDDLERTLAAASASRASLESELGLLEEVRILWNAWLEGNVDSGGLPSPDLRPLLAEMVVALPGDVRLTRLSFRRDGGAWTLEADALAVAPSATKSHASMERFVRAVDASPLVESVSMKPLRYEKDPAKVSAGFEFSVVVRVRGAMRGASS